jgi:hypothetical protein
MEYVVMAPSVLEFYQLLLYQPPGLEELAFLTFAFSFQKEGGSI